MDKVEYGAAREEGNMKTTEKVYGCGGGESTEGLCSGGGYWVRGRWRSPYDWCFHCIVLAGKRLSKAVHFLKTQITFKILLSLKEFANL